MGYRCHRRGFPLTIIHTYIHRRIMALCHLVLTPLNGTFVKKFIKVPTAPEVLRIGRQTNAKTVPLFSNGFFDSKVLSRQHAELWADRAGRVWIRDVKSSNGTFLNGKRLSQENRESEPFELRLGDILELGIDILSEDSTTVIHHKVASRVDFAGREENVTGLDGQGINGSVSVSKMVKGPKSSGNRTFTSGTPQAYYPSLEIVSRKLQVFVNTGRFGTDLLSLRF